MEVQSGTKLDEIPVPPLAPAAPLAPSAAAVGNPAALTSGQDIPLIEGL